MTKRRDIEFNDDHVRRRRISTTFIAVFSTPFPDHTNPSGTLLISICTTYFDNHIFRKKFNMTDDMRDGSNRRRIFLRQVATVSTSLPFAHGLVAGATGGGLLATAASSQADTPPTACASTPAVNNVFGYISFGPDEASFVEAMVNVMCPADQHTPNGVDCGLAIYIDRQLAGSYGQGAKRYLRGPFGLGIPQQGPQIPLTPEQHFKTGVAAANQAITERTGKPFEQLSPVNADAALHEVASGKLTHGELDLAEWFNGLVYPLFTQACYADPIYGGNFNKVFWKMIGYPGLPATHTLDMVQYRGKPFPGASDPKSIVDFS